MRILVVVVMAAAAAASGLVLLALAILVVSMVLVVMLRMCMCMCMRMRVLLLLLLTLLLLVLLLFVLRKAFSYVAVLATGTVIFLVAGFGSVGAETVVAYLVAWFLLLSGVRVVLEDNLDAGDAGNLASLTHIWRGFWVLLWLAGSIAAVAIGGSLLV